MKTYVFPGQGSQFPGMGRELYEQHESVRQLYEHANELLGYRITDVMFEGSAEDLKQTKITQPAMFLHGMGKVYAAGDAFQPEAVAGHSLGEFTALVAAGALTFEDGLSLVYQRALAMQKACEITEGTMAAILGLEDEVVEEVCEQVNGIVVAANYNCPGQLVISGEVEAVETAVEKLKERGARRAILLPVGGAFHSPLMKPAQEELEQAIAATPLVAPSCPVYQNVTAEPVTEPEEIRKNLIAQLTGPVRWTQIMRNMVRDGLSEYIEVGGNGKTLRGFIMRIDRKIPNSAL